MVEDRVVQAAVSGLSGRGPMGPAPQQQQQMTLEQIMQMIQATATTTGASLQGWADLVDVGVLTPEQVFNLIFRQMPPAEFQGKKPFKAEVKPVAEPTVGQMSSNLTGAGGIQQ